MAEVRGASPQGFPATRPRTGSHLDPVLVRSIFAQASSVPCACLLEHCTYSSTIMCPNDSYSLRHQRRIRSPHLAQSPLQGLQFKHARAASAPQCEKAAHRRHRWPGGGACSTGKMPSRASTSASLMSLRLGTLRWRGIGSYVEAV